MKNSFELDLIKFAKGGYQSEILSYEECFSIMCDAHYRNGYPEWKPSDEWILNRCMGVYRVYYDMNDFSYILERELDNLSLKLWGEQKQMFDNKTWKTLIASQLLFKFLDIDIYQCLDLAKSELDENIINEIKSFEKLKDVI